MIEICCLTMLIIIIVIIVFALLPKEHTIKVVPTQQPQVQKVYVKNCPKCGTENDATNQFCTHCGNKL